MLFRSTRDKNAYPHAFDSIVQVGQHRRRTGGTPLGSPTRIAQQVVDAVGNVRAAGIPVVLSTGRGWAGTKPLAEALRLPPGQHVSSNGAVRVSYPPLELLEQVTFAPSDVVERVLAEHPEAMLAVEVIGRGFKVNRPFPEG